MSHHVPFVLLVLFLLGQHALPAADEDYKPGPDSIAQPGVPRGELIKGRYTAQDRSEFPGTERDYTIYLPPAGSGFDKTKPAPFMVFQDGVIYNAPTVFDNLIAKHELPPLIGIFIKPGVVPSANPNALPRYNRSYEYDSVTPAYSHFLIDEFLPAIAKEHGLALSTDPNDAAICGNSSGGICAFMTAWHRPDRFRRVFSGVGTYVGIHGADQLPVLVRKYEPKPLRIYLQSGEHDNNLYCGDWWMANQTMERALTWAGYDVNHTWGTGGHNAKHATAIFPDVLRWLWKGWPEAKEIKANPRGESKWVGYSVLGDGKWEVVKSPEGKQTWEHLAPNAKGDVVAWGTSHPQWAFALFESDGKSSRLHLPVSIPRAVAWTRDETMIVASGDPSHDKLGLFRVKNGMSTKWAEGIGGFLTNMVITFDGRLYCTDESWLARVDPDGKVLDAAGHLDLHMSHPVLSPDQSTLYAINGWHPTGSQIESWQIKPDGTVCNREVGFYQLQGNAYTMGLCVDAEGLLYAATSLGVQVCDQAGRVNFIIPTPEYPNDVCFGGKDLSEIFIACNGNIYKRPTKAHGVIPGQQAPIKPAAPKL